MSHTEGEKAGVHLLSCDPILSMQDLGDKDKSEQRDTCSMRHLTSDWLKGRGIMSTRRPRSCEQYSNTRKIESGLLPVTTFFKCTMLGCWQVCNTLISRMDVTGTPAAVQLGSSGKLGNSQVSTRVLLHEAVQ